MTKSARALVLVMLVGATASCGLARNTVGKLGGAGSARGANRIEINDIVFRSKLSIGGETRRDLTITVQPVAIDPTAALEAGRYRATVYCLKTFGSSEADWVVGPDTPVEQLRIVDDSVTLQGSCAAR